jgi:alkylation response protein AidB-like acyl-CoA dehydrogenase
MALTVEMATGGDALLDRVREIVPRIRARATDAERERRLPDETIADLLESGVLHVHVPVEFGGYELGLSEHYHAVRLLAQGCVSTAWTASFLAQTALWIGRFPLEVQREIMGAPGYKGTAGTNQTRGHCEAVPVDGGYRLSGRWGFASGCIHADWVIASVPLGAQVGVARQRLFCVVPMSEMTIDDMWHTSGMRATGSNDILADDVFVPEERTIRTDVLESGQTPGALARPHYTPLRYPHFRIANALHPAYVVGAAERALDVFREHVAPKRNRPWNSGLLAENPVIQMRYATAVHKVQIARLLGEDQLNLSIRGAESPDGYSLEARAHMNMEAVGSITAAGEAVTILARMSGGSIHRLGSEIDRIQRDVEVLLNHSTGDFDFAAEHCGSVLLGQGLGKRPNQFF